ncbi:MAG: hypothetical protein CL670_01035 [Balneola sp.]|jgi:uncharacterized damage-inducible protein DinB|nr:hypothetical protein [Balneola sp.]MBE77718.1 hypothetical protein [Balneola sp.]|tara:strand:+ start:1065 stop:1508 length:444 start_codon:yes stop_codon:yes gene_type:complete
MMNFERLISYDQWANQKIYEAFQAVEEDEVRAEIEAMFSHLLATQAVWMSRITGEKVTFGIWPSFDSSEMEKLIKNHPSKLKGLIDRQEEVISYENSKGVAHESKVSDILMHLIIHGQHHRAQIAKMLRADRATPPGTDFIFFTREN